MPIMTKPSKYNILFKYQDFLIFLGLLLWASILNVAKLRTDVWSSFFFTMLFLGICLLPVLIFSYYKEQFKTSLTPKQYWFYWASCYVILLPLFTIGAAYLKLGNYPLGLLINFDSKILKNNIKLIAKNTESCLAQRKYLDFIVGDVMHSHANIEKIRQILLYEPECYIDEGINKTIKWNIQVK